MKEIKGHTAFYKILTSALPLLLLIIFLFNISGYHILFNIIQNKIRKEVKARIKSAINDRDLLILNVNEREKQDLDWIRADEEFVYRGEMYDVATISKHGDRILIYCINDRREKNLIENYAKNHETNRRTRNLLSLFSNVFILQPELFNPFIGKSDREFHIPVFHILKKIKEITLPPPKQVFTA